MLVLARRIGEEIIINGNIRISIVSVKGDRVRIGVDAPKTVLVDRAEIHEKRNDCIHHDLPESCDPHAETRSDLPIVEPVVSMR